MPNLSDASVCGIKSGMRLQWEERQMGHVLLYPEGMIRLSESAAEILQMCCDGNQSIGAGIEKLVTIYDDADIRHDVLDFLGSAYERGWITVS